MEIRKRILSVLLALTMVISFMTVISLAVSADGFEGKIVKRNGQWICVDQNGRFMSDANGIYKNKNGWWKTTNGVVTFKETGVFQNEHGWWRVEKSKVNFDANGVYKNKYGWWKTTNGRVNFKENGVFKNDYGWWRVEKSKVNFKANGIYKNDYGWWKTTNGKVTFKENGVFQNENGWWRVENSKVNFNANGIYVNGNGAWYVNNGKVDFGYNGLISYNDELYSVINGKADVYYVEDFDNTPAENEIVDDIVNGDATNDKTDDNNSGGNVTNVTVDPYFTKAAFVKTGVAGIYYVEFNFKNPSEIRLDKQGYDIRVKGGTWDSKEVDFASNETRTKESTGYGAELTTKPQTYTNSYPIEYDKTYEVKGFVEFNGKRFYSDTVTILINKPTPVTPTADTKPVVNLSCSSAKVSNVTSSSARFDFTINNPDKVSVPNCGAMIRPKNGEWTTHTESIISDHQKLASCPVWYEVGKGKEFNYTLSQGTTYEIKGFCKYNGNTYYSGVVSFTVPKPNTTKADNSLSAKMYNFKQNANWKDGTSWVSSQKSKTNSSSGYTGCAAYAYDFVKTVHGISGPPNGTYYKSTSEIKPGDVLHIYCTGPSAWVGEHWICIYGRSGNKLLTLEGAYTGKVVRVVDSYSSSYTPYEITGTYTLKMGNVSYTIDHPPIQYSGGRQSSPFGGWHY